MAMATATELSKDANCDNEIEATASLNTRDIKGRLRNHSYKEATAIATTPLTSKRASKITSIVEEETQEVSVNANPSEELGDTYSLGSLEDIIIPAVMLKKEDWQGKNMTHKLDTVFESINKLYDVYHRVNNRFKPIEFAVFDKADGVLPQMAQIVDHAKTVDQRFEDLTAENAQLRDELDIVKGLVHKQSKQIDSLQHKLADQIARSMENNITISGILGDSAKIDEVGVRSQVELFLEEQLELEIEDGEIIKAYHSGTYTTEKHRMIVATVTPNLKQRIFQNASKLKGKVNKDQLPFSINQQLPDLLVEKRREIRQIIKDKKDQEKGMDESQKSKILVRNSKVFINGQLQRKALIPPKPSDLFPDLEEQERINAIKLTYTQSRSANKCSFRAAACVASKMNDVHLAYKKVFQENPGADHIVAACSSEGTQGYQDDGEFGAGHRILKVINDAKLGDIAVFVIRDYGGENLGPTRFAVMKDLAAEAIYQLK